LTNLDAGRIVRFASGDGVRPNCLTDIDPKADDSCGSNYSGGAGPMPRTSKRTEYCQRQAAECASAAMTTTLSEAREAHLNMEQAWLQLRLTSTATRPLQLREIRVAASPALVEGELAGMAARVLNANPACESEVAQSRF
jgi:hypothetical protein